MVYLNTSAVTGDNSVVCPLALGVTNFDMTEKHRWVKTSSCSCYGFVNHLVVEKSKHIIMQVCDLEIIYFYFRRHKI